MKKAVVKKKEVKMDAKTKKLPTFLQKIIAKKAKKK